MTGIQNPGSTAKPMIRGVMIRNHLANRGECNEGMKVGINRPSSEIVIKQKINSSSGGGNEVG